MGEGRKQDSGPVVSKGVKKLGWDHRPAQEASSNKILPKKGSVTERKNTEKAAWHGDTPARTRSSEADLFCFTTGRVRKKKRRAMRLEK